MISNSVVALYFPLLSSFKAAVPKLLGTRDWLCGDRDSTGRRGMAQAVTRAMGNGSAAVPAWPWCTFCCVARLLTARRPAELGTPALNHRVPSEPCSQWRLLSSLNMLPPRLRSRGSGVVAPRLRSLVQGLSRRGTWDLSDQGSSPVSCVSRQILYH